METETFVSRRWSLWLWKESACLYICGQMQLHPNRPVEIGGFPSILLWGSFFVTCISTFRPTCKKKNWQNVTLTVIDTWVWWIVLSCFTWENLLKPKVYCPHLRCTLKQGCSVIDTAVKKTAPNQILLLIDKIFKSPSLLMIIFYLRFLLDKES